MKLTKEKLKQIIKEELMNETGGGSGEGIQAWSSGEEPPGRIDKFKHRRARDEKARFFTSSKLGQLITAGKDGLPNWSGEKYIQIYLSELEVYADDQAAADKAKNAFWNDMDIRDPSLYRDDEEEL